MHITTAYTHLFHISLNCAINFDKMYKLLYAY